MRLDLEVDRRPSVAAFMLRGFLPSPGLRESAGLPPIRVAWRGHTIDRRHLEQFLTLTGLPAGEHVPLLYPHVSAFSLQMMILTHRAFPLPIWRALQVRNHLLQHAPIPVGAELDMETCVAGHRILDKGAEVDLHTVVRSGATLLWESSNAFFYRGRFGAPQQASARARAPRVEGPVVAEWDTIAGVGRRFAALTGDYNGLHYWGWYARRLGFRGAFHHPQLVLGHCLARLPETGEAGPAELETWLKGPVYYGAHATLRAARAPEGVAFALHADGDERPAIVARWSPATGASVRTLAR